MANSTLYAVTAAKNPSYIDSARHVACEKYEAFDVMSHKVVARLMGKDVSTIDFKDTNQIIFASLVKIAVVALVVFAAFISLFNPLFVLAGLAVGAVTSTEGTRKTVQSWMEEGYKLIISPIYKNDNLVQKIVIISALIIVGLPSMALLTPAALGLAVAYGSKRISESFRDEEARRSQNAPAQVAPRGVAAVFPSHV
jgi:hypothetical protein